MNKYLLQLVGAMAILITGLHLTGCAATSPTKHLSSDVCLVMPESTTKAEVLSFLGDPDQKTTSHDGDEVWVYYKEDKDIIRKIPLIGEQLGTHSYEIVTISFIDTKVRTCIYRQLTPTEFNDLNRDLKIEIPE